MSICIVIVFDSPRLISLCPQTILRSIIGLLHNSYEFKHFNFIPTKHLKLLLLDMTSWEQNSVKRSGIQQKNMYNFICFLLYLYDKKPSV